MVAPLIAKAATRLGPKIRSAGGKFMHSSREGTRSMGSKMLGMNDKKVEAGITKLVKKADLSLKFISKISTGVSKVLGSMAKHSPALKQQLIIMNKGLSVMIRPIGDIMAKFMRPMSVWVMKVAQKWYALFGTGGKDTKQSKEDTLDNALKQFESAKAGGNPEAIAKAREGVLTAQRNVQTGDDKKGLWKNLIPEGLKESLTSIGAAFKSLWEALKQVGGVIWDLIGPVVKILVDGLGIALLGALKIVTWAFDLIRLTIDGLVIVLKVLRLGIQTVWGWIRKTALEISVNFVRNIALLYEAFKKVANFLKDNFVTTINNFKAAWEGLWSAIKRIIAKIKFWKRDKKDDDTGKAVGGAIQETGMYKLHAGERVLTAGDTTRTNNDSKSISFSTVIHVAATIANDLDINDLAKKLAELNETELRRRVSNF